MFYSDYHVHTSFSGDCEATPESMITKAIDLGLKKICLTDHYDADFPTDAIDFTFDIDTYFKTLSQLKEKYSNTIDLLIGVELGLQPHLKGFYEDLLNSYDFDFIIGSSHVVDALDPYEKNYYNDKDEHTAYYRYLESIQENIDAFSGFQVYGHLDYIIRYSPFKKHISYHDYTDILDKVFLNLIHRSKGIEVNTSGLRYGLGHTHPNMDIIKRYKELGGEILTIGSDAHKPEDICSHFNDVTTLLKDMGYKYYSIFQKQEPSFIKL
ncbi:histidinol-phosphatase (PHP family) [Natranaerovirga hydrolytica]|uniref:Histidinol-phosphatase n=1 Tax=Natranaerovirga hydrolytica TaxID=680378 RepID=A0A4R1MZ60_9FIRM|nr:histidinol-phosphatase HisJ family protein [Natranaerovirga hydrolytica]TCK98546.1 histidinol-phosphatase (PHP family) [Natranaerovirga hydrolytica]